MTGILAIDVRRAGGGDWMVGRTIPDSAYEITAKASRESIFCGRPLIFACISVPLSHSEFLLVTTTVEDRIVRLQLSPEVVEEIYGPAPDSERWIAWLRKNANS